MQSSSKDSVQKLFNFWTENCIRQDSNAVSHGAPVNLPRIAAIVEDNSFLNGGENMGY